MSASAPVSSSTSDVKKLGRIQGGAGKRVRDGRHQHYNRRVTDRAGKRRNTVGWDFVHIAIDDCTRLAYAEVLSDEKASTAVAFLARALAFYARHGRSPSTISRELRRNADRGGYRARTAHASPRGAPAARSRPSSRPTSRCGKSCTGDGGSEREQRNDGEIEPTTAR
jgi:hypothetical protein